MATYLDFAHWRKELASDLFGNIWLAKFSFDLAQGNLLPVIERVFEDAVTNSMSSFSDGDAILDLLYSVVELQSTELLLQGQRAPRVHRPYSCIMRVEVFADYYLSPEFTTRIDDSSERAEIVWNHLGGMITPIMFDNSLRTDLPLFWCTPTDVLNGIIQKFSANRAATAIRTRLGLLGMNKGQRIIKIDIPPGAVDGKQIMAPTALDAARNNAFLPSVSSDGYGRTLNLKAAKRDLKELVCEEIPFTSSFEANKVGTVGARCPTVDWSKVKRLI